MNSLISNHEPEFIAALDHLRLELLSIRGNRAHPSLVENIKVNSYGSEMRLKELATITIPEPRTITVAPWDKNIIKEIEHALHEASLNVGIANDGVVVRVTLPALTAESRQALLKVLHQKLETSRVQIRQLREKIRESIIKAEKDKTISEDERFKAQDDLEELVKKYIEEINVLGSHKEEEVMTV